MRSSLEVYDLARGRTRVLWETDDLIEAPNWHPDGWLLVNRDGRLLRVPLDGGEVAVIDSGIAQACIAFLSLAVRRNRLCAMCRPIGTASARTGQRSPIVRGAAGDTRFACSRMLRFS
jgi:hypothetical protein